eukprot:1913610-Pyramimonas_sp.AAC.1
MFATAVSEAQTSANQLALRAPAAQAETDERSAKLEDQIRVLQDSRDHQDCEGEPRGEYSMAAVGPRPP